MASTAVDSTSEVDSIHSDVSPILLPCRDKFKADSSPKEPPTKVCRRSEVINID